MSSMIGATGVSPVKGTGYNQVSVPNKNASQMGLYNQGAEGLQGSIPQMLQQLMQLSGGGTPEMWQQLEAPAMRQFGQLQGQMASRFSGMGMGGRKSSGFNNAGQDAATDLSERLQSNRMGLQQGAQDRLMQLYQNLMGQDLSTNAFIPKQKPWWQELLLGSIPGLVQGGAQGAGTAVAAKALTALI